MQGMKNEKGMKKGRITSLTFGHGSSDAAQNTFGFLDRECPLLGHINLLVGITPSPSS